MIKSLDAFRFYAFFLVFLFHIDFLRVGYTGVLAFFVLSGFLLTPILLRLKQSEHIGHYFGTFLGRRSLRIFPLYFGYLFLLVGVSVFLTRAVQVTPPIVEIIKRHLPYAFTYTTNFFHAAPTYQGTPLLSHLWSLSVEEQFYLIWPLAIWLCPQRYLRLFLISLIILGPVFRWMTQSLVESNFATAVVKNPDLVVYLMPWCHLDAFSAGALVAILPTQKNSRATWLGIFVALLLGYGTQLLGSGHLEWSTLGYPPFMRGEGKLIWGYSVVLLAFALMIRGLVSGCFSIPGKNSSVVQYLGRISYGLYIFHYPIILFVVDRKLFGEVRWVNCVLSFVLTLLISSLSYHFFERHFLELKDKWFDYSKSRQSNGVDEQSNKLPQWTDPLQTE